MADLAAKEYINRYNGRASRTGTAGDTGTRHSVGSQELELFRRDGEGTTGLHGSSVSGLKRVYSTTVGAYGYKARRESL